MECEKMHNMHNIKNDTAQFTLTFRDLVVKHVQGQLDISSIQEGV